MNTGAAGTRSTATQGRRLVAVMLDLLFPSKCCGCGAVGQGEWCARCDRETARLRGAEARFVCEVDDQPAFDVVAAARHAGQLREAIHAFKYEGAPNLAAPFGRMMAAALADQAIVADALVPVPLHPKRRRERGYNQSEKLAEAIGLARGIALDARALARTRNTAHQVELNARERKANVQDAFRADEARVRGRRILLVDDVFTTGATLGECVKALRGAGASEVRAVTLAKA